MPQEQATTPSGRQTAAASAQTGAGKTQKADTSTVQTAHHDLVVISTYTIEGAQNAYDLVRELRTMAKEVLSKWSAFRSSTVHMSQDYHQVLVYETWTERSSFLTAWDSDEARAFTDRIKALSLGIDARIFTVEDCIFGPHTDLD
jgi:hypothetical protein